MERNSSLTAFPVNPVVMVSGHLSIVCRRIHTLVYHPRGLIDVEIPYGTVVCICATSCSSREQASCPQITGDLPTTATGKVYDPHCCSLIDQHSAGVDCDGRKIKCDRGRSSIDCVARVLLGRRPRQRPGWYSREVGYIAGSKPDLPVRGRPCPQSPDPVRDGFASMLRRSSTPGQWVHCRWRYSLDTTA